MSFDTRLTLLNGSTVLIVVDHRGHMSASIERQGGAMEGGISRPDSGMRRASFGAPLGTSTFAAKGGA